MHPNLDATRVPASTVRSRMGLWSRAVCAPITFLVALALLGLDGRLGPASLPIRRVAALVALSIVVASTIAFRPGWRWIAGSAVALASLCFLSRATSAPCAEAWFALALAAIVASPGDPGRGSRIPDGLVQSVLTYVLLQFARDLVPRISSPGVAISDWASRYIGRSGGGEIATSYDSLGGGAILLAVTHLFWRWRLAGGLARLIGAAALPAAWFATTAWVVPKAEAGPLAPFVRGTLLGCAWLAIAVLLDALIPGPIRRRGIAGHGRARRIVLAAACVTAMAAGVCSVGTSLLGPPANRRILVHNRGGLDWDRPEFGRFGLFSGGMFGLFPVYCRAEGYEFGVIDKDTIGPGDLHGAQTLILINSPKVWAGEERRTILEFVERGGSLLVLGDHTDVFGLMGGFNSLLVDFGIQFRFDSAYKAREGWRGCQVASPDAVAWGWDLENPSVAVGASLALSGPARPLLTGRYGFSDAGSRDNTIGSFLGNYRYDGGEPIGDVVLVATAARGLGRVVVWGDTSAFQGGLSTTYAKVVGPTLAWLSRPASWAEQPRFRGPIAFGILAAIAGLWLFRSTAPAAWAVAACLVLGLVATYASSVPNLDARITIGEDAFLVDDSHMPASGHYEAHINSVGPLYSNLLRGGFRVVDLEDWDVDAIARARGIALIAPRRTLRPAEVDDLLRSEEAGTVVLLATGQPDSAASRGLLRAHGLALAPRPLGTVTDAGPRAGPRERENEPRFLDAWPITTVDGGDPSLLPGVEVIYRSGDDAVALFLRMGKGGLLLFADTRFFSDANVEGVSGHWPGNLALIHDVLVRYAGARPDAVAPLFRSPVKPR